MNKAELVAAAAAKTKLTKKTTEEALDAIIAAITDELANGGKVQLIGFGNFEVRPRKARQGRNPKDPKVTVDIPAGKAAVFKAGKALKDAVNK